jgi:GxxExxY protein
MDDTQVDGFRVAEPSGAGYNFEPLSDKVLGAAIEVHKRLGPGFREDLYANALCIELEKRRLRYGREVQVAVHYDGVAVGDHELDLVVEDAIIVELKAVSMLLQVHQAQLMAYLRATNLRVGLLLNFGEIPLGIKRIVNKYSG